MTQALADRTEPPLRLSSYHRRCLAQRIGECDEALVQAVCALCQAERWVPDDLSLQALCGVVEAAQRLTELAHRMSRAGVSAPARDCGSATP
jgi:hypothetical protein